MPDQQDQPNELVRLAREHAEATIERAGLPPVDELGQLQIPHTPRQVDYDALSNELGRALTDQDRAEYEDQFFRTIRLHLAENYPADMVEEWAGRR